MTAAELLEYLKNYLNDENINPNLRIQISVNTPSGWESSNKIEIENEEYGLILRGY